MKADNNCEMNSVAVLLCLLALLAIGCSSGDQVSKAHSVKNFVTACQEAGLDAKLLTGFEPRASLSLTSESQFDKIPASGDVLLEMQIDGVALTIPQMQALSGRDIAKFAVNDCKIDIAAFLRLCAVIEVDDFFATEVSFASEEAAGIANGQLSAKSINIENCGRDFSIAVLQSIENVQDVKATTQLDIVLSLGTLEKTRNLNLTGFNIDVAEDGRFHESKNLESVVIANGTVDDFAISQLLLISSLRVLILSDVVIEELDSIAFPDNVPVPDVHISGNRELLSLFRAKCPKTTLVNGSPGRRAVDIVE